MSEYRKFKFIDLPKSAVVNSTVYSNSREIDDIINNAVAEHLNNIVGSDSSLDESDNEQRQSAAEEKVIDENLENHNIDDHEADMDIEAIRQEEYEKAMSEAKALYEPMIADKIRDQDLAALLQQKLTAIIAEVDIDSQIAKVSAEAISGIARKLHLVLPANFEEIVTKGLIDKLNKFYKKGKITLTINPARYDVCLRLLELESIPSKFKDGFEIIRDDKLGIDDCRVEWQDTCLEYNQEQIAAEIEKIIEQLKSAK